MIHNNLPFQIKAIYQYLTIFGINIILFLVLIFAPDIQITMVLGALLFFLTAYITPKHISIWRLVAYFSLQSIPFIIAGYIFYSLKYFDDGINLQSAKSIFPAFSLLLLLLAFGFLLGTLIRRLVRNIEIRQYLFLSMICMFLAFLSGSQGWPIQLVFTGLIFFIASLIADTKSISQKVLFYFILILPFSLVYSPPIIINGLSHAYPIVLIPLISPLIGIFCKHLVNKSKTKLAYGIGVLYILFLGSGYWGMYNYLQYVNRFDFKPLATDLKFDFFSPKISSLTQDDIHGKTVLIYFQTKSCSVCYKKLPELQRLYNEYSNDTSILIIPVFLKYSKDEDTSFILEYNRKFGYTYQQYFSRELIDTIEKQFNLTAYPQAMLISKTGEILHNGGFNNDPLIFVDNMSTLILSDK